jgi:autophagy-related protein 2
LSLKAISLYLPSQHQHIHVHATSAESVANLAQSMGASSYPQAPGAFSVHGLPRPSPEESRPAANKPQYELDDTLEVDLSPISIQFDASLGFLLAMVVGRLMSVLRQDCSPTAEKSPAPTASEGSTPRNVKIFAQELSVDFVNHLVGVADTLERHLDPNAFNIDKEILLNTTLQNMTITTSHAEGKTAAVSGKSPNKSSTSSSTTKIELERFRFGYADDDIVSFDKARPMSTSIRDTFLSAGQDVGVKFVSAGDHTRTDIETLPLVVQIDLQRLDETFGWFGGLSSFFNMSTSMASVHSPILTQSHIQPKKSPRVRFDAPLNPDNKASAAESKVNLRIGGSWIELKGKECSLFLRLVWWSE